MTDDPDPSHWFPPAMFAEQVQETGEQWAESQQEVLEAMMASSQSTPFDASSAIGPMTLGTATFKARVQSGGRISVPEPERDALDIEEGDIVQTIVVPIKRDREDDD